MLSRLHVKGYKSLIDAEVALKPLTLLFGPNTAGKSNLLDAVQLLSRLATSHTLKEAFEPPCRGKPLESFTMGDGGVKALREQERLAFSIEADLHISDAIAKAVDREIFEMRRPAGAGKVPAYVRERRLRYRLAVEMLPSSGLLRVTDEYLAALTADGRPARRRKPFIERQGHQIHLRQEGKARPKLYERHLDHAILSMPHYAPHYPHLAAVRRELGSWRFFYFEPRERMRAATPIKEVRHVGAMGEELAAFLITLKIRQPRQFQALEKALRMLLPDVDGIETDVNDLGEAEFRLRENGVAIPARVLSEGTLRLLGLLALTGAEDTPALVGFEEPENGVHPRRIELIADLLKTGSESGETQYIVTTHSPILPDRLPNESLFVVQRINRETHVASFGTWGPLRRHLGIRNALDDRHEPPPISDVFADALGRVLGNDLDDRHEPLPISDRILRGDFDA